MKATNTLQITISTVQIGDSVLAITTIGGVQIRGRLTDSAVLAVRSLFAILSERGDDSEIGIQLALSGSSLKELAGEDA